MRSTKRLRRDSRCLCPTGHSSTASMRTLTIPTLGSFESAGVGTGFAGRNPPARSSNLVLPTLLEQKPSSGNNPIALHVIAQDRGVRFVHIEDEPHQMTGLLFGSSSPS